MLLMKLKKWWFVPLSLGFAGLYLRFVFLMEHVKDQELVQVVDFGGVESKCMWANDALSTTCRQKSVDALAEIARILNSKAYKETNSTKLNKLSEFGSGFGMHTLVDTGKPNTTCIFYSYGISRDYSFDEQLSRDWECKGFLFDPSIVYPAKLKQHLHFFNLGAPLLSTDMATDCFSDPTRPRCTNLAEWITVSPPQVMALFHHRHIDVLKMDCEGCEYALARDIASFDPAFLSKVGQFALEVHASKWWGKDELHTHYLGLLYHMLLSHGFALVHATISGCARVTEEVGCPPGMEAVGYPCGVGRSCQNYLFARA
jgi:hypothetical protein